MRFKNREEAGRRLVDRLIRFRDDPAAIILALPRSGVAVGYQLSLGLHLPLAAIPVNNFACFRLAPRRIRYLDVRRGKAMA